MAAMTVGRVRLVVRGEIRMIDAVIVDRADHGADAPPAIGRRRSILHCCVPGDSIGM